MVDWYGEPMLEKTELLKKLNTIIISNKEIKPILEYISNTYGSKFLNSFKVIKNNDKN